jgi:hypothetical protein
MQQTFSFLASIALLSKWYKSGGLLTLYLLLAFKLPIRVCPLATMAILS